MKKRMVLISMALGTLLLAGGCGTDAVSSGSSQSSAAGASSSPAATQAAAVEKSSSLAPDVRLKGLDGQERMLSDLYKDKPLYVNFWASWCPPCVKELPHIEGLYQKYGDRVAFAAVSVDEHSEDAQALAQKSGLTLPVYTGNNAELSRNYGLDAIPVSLLIGKDGKILAKTVGGMTEKQLEAFLQPALK